MMGAAASPAPLRLRTLEAAAFAPYGEVVAAASARQTYAINEGSSLRFHDLARIEPGPGGRAILSIFRCRAEDGSPIRIRMMERHPLGSQAFVPIGGGPRRGGVPPPGDTGTPARIAALRPPGRQRG